MSDTLFDQYKAALRHGHLAALAGDLEAALGAYRVAANLVPERALPIASQGTVLHRLDRWPEAVEAFEAALRMAPDDEAALRARAVAREQRGLRSGAAADYERLAFVLDVASRSAEAATAARHAADLQPSATREALADRLAAAAAHVAELVPPRSAPVANFTGAEAEDRGLAEVPGNIEPVSEAALAIAATGTETQEATKRPDEMSPALTARIAELGTQPSWVDLDDRQVNPLAAGDVDGDGRPWPPVDLPSPPPPPIEGPPPDPETLLAEAVELIAAGDPQGARDRMLIAAMVHRTAGRLDAALEVCLQLLSTAPGDPQVHLALANLQLDRGWTGVATEKIDLLLRLTALTGDTQAEADVHGLASERLRDEPMGIASTR